MYRITLLAALFAAGMNANAASGKNERYLDLVRQARTAYGSGDYGPAERLFLDALDTLEDENASRAETLAELGDVYTIEERFTKAEQVYGQSLTMYRQLRDEKNIAIDLRRLGELYSLEGRGDEAMAVLQEALKRARAIHDTAEQAEALNIIGIVYYRNHNISKAARYFNQALEIDSTSGVSEMRAALLNNLGNIYQAQRKYPEAEAALKRALNEIEALSGRSHPELTSTLLSLGHLYTETRRYADAESQYRRALAILEPRQREFEGPFARTLHALSAMYARSGRSQEADAVLERAAAIARRTLSQHIDMASILEDYSTSLRSRGHSQEASELLAEVRRARLAVSLVRRRQTQLSSDQPADAGPRQ
jgi:tetratricopeptide (TPR) repeat protein